MHKNDPFPIRKGMALIQYHPKQIKRDCSSQFKTSECLPVKTGRNEILEIGYLLNKFL